MPRHLDKQERRETRDAARAVAAWISQARRVQERQAATHEDVRRRLAELASAAVPVARASEVAWRVLLLSKDDAESLLRALVARADLPQPAPQEATALTQLTDRAPAAVDAARTLSPVRWMFASRRRREQIVPHASYLRELFAWGLQAGITEVLDRLAKPTGELDPAQLSADDLLDPRLGLAAATGATAPPSLLDATRFGELPRAMADLRAAAEEERSARDAVVRAVAAYRSPAVHAALARMPLETLKEATTGSLRLTPLLTAGITSVQEVLDRRRELHLLPGIGSGFRDNLVAAAETLAQITADEQPVRLAGTLDPVSEAAVLALAAWDGVRRTRGAGSDLAVADDLRPLAAVLDDRVHRLLVLPVRNVPATGVADAIVTVVRRADVVTATSARGVPSDARADFASRPADYYAMLGELGYLTEDEEASHGELPAGLVESVREQALRTEALTVALRGYQSFGARFALVQRKVILGDEMGLGKTIEALAVLAHLWATGATHFLVVCPPGVLVNWLREIAARSTLDAHRIHGPEWQDAAAAWVSGGGIAVTTYDTTWMESGAWARGPTIACVVVDEAQYVKNPEAQRSRRTAALVAGVERAILLTGTPMQNHVGEFRTLISYLQPGLVAGKEELAPRLFRRAVAPAYLRRNQEDVLAELPGLVEVEEWLPLGPEDVATYREAVAAGNLMRMRRAAMMHGLDSPKVDRLVEIVEEAEDNGRRVIVYSFFNDVLAEVHKVLSGPVFGPLDGSVAAGARQRLVDEFSAAEGGAALLAQVTTGGVGLNIQSASVVVLCEPQLNPALEAQAVARAHRMGQLQSVQVHRLLSEDAVDERIHELLAHKRQLFEEYAGTSATADAAPEATDAEIARQVLAAERERLLYEPPAAPAPDDA
ncbi:DEAD/DEAH box helicase [Nocardioides bizhenqiangii]|uniref:DEAD/DEAH box helicase n=1 Tax=Nocardioides bizhenqiangii TaxID=3095076 RepID=A0ABZ0ZTV7_9ACTN|nr:DEAD/DEAH box helicase [Nocardioides sp. HM61]WQQ27742.1 DEAD/DEAH box helicase [Nocardioides sp. HM61]